MWPLFLKSKTFTIQQAGTAIYNVLSYTFVTYLQLAGGTKLKSKEIAEMGTETLKLGSPIDEAKMQTSKVVGTSPGSPSVTDTWAVAAVIWKFMRAMRRRKKLCESESVTSRTMQT